MIYGIVAIADNNVIGNKGSIPWKYKEDLAFFKERTIGKAVVMGRKTFDSLKAPLQKRMNLILTNRSLQCGTALPITDRKTVLDMNQHMDVYIIGGHSVWKLFCGDIDRWFITKIPESPEGDIHFDNFYLKHFHKSGEIKLEQLVVEIYDRDK